MHSTPPMQLSLNFGEEVITSLPHAQGVLASATAKLNVSPPDSPFEITAEIVSLCGVRAERKQHKVTSIYQNIRDSIRHIG